MSIILLSVGEAQQMIKYNNKEESQQEIRLDSIANIPSNRILSQNSKGHLRPQKKGGINERSFSSESPVERDTKALNNLAGRRSKSHKVNYEMFNRSKLRNELLRKREGRSNKMDLLVILPNQCQGENYHQHEQSLDNLCLNHRAITKFSESTPFQTPQSMPKQDQNKFAVRGDIAIGKMKLLAHKSKLTPIRQKSKDFKEIRELYQSEEKLNDIEKMAATSYKHFLQRERLTIQKWQSNQKNKLQIGKERYLKLAQGNQMNLMNIHSIVPNISIAEKLNYAQLKQRRRTTQPNIDTSDQFYKVTQDGLGTIYDKQFKSSIGKIQPERDFNFSHGKQRIKTYGSKLKSIQWKRKAFHSNLTQFIQPYQTYYYRDMLWKINYSNRQFIEPPLQYQHRLKAYVGKGNNSAMVRGLISRRYWFAITDRIQQANFIWTQLKQFRYFAIQKSSNSDRIPSLNKTGTYAQKKILLNEDQQQHKTYCERNKAMEEHSDERMLPRLKHFTYCLMVRGQAIKEGRLHNHLINNYIISNKKSLFRVLSSYYRYHSLDPFQVIPITYHVSNGLEDPTFLAFQRYYHHQAKSIRKGESNRRNYWIVKPGQNSNRGNGIKLCFKLSQIKAIVRQKGVWEDGSQKTYILQSYIEKPLLYYKRKFDLRHYMLITSVNGFIKGYWYSDGYVRTTSSEYTLDFNGNNVHLTNDAIQKYLPNYGKFQKGNKLSYDQLEAYIKKKKSSKHGFYSHIQPQMRKIAIDIIKASANYLDPKKLNDNFELFGLDFMIDETFNVWLIEVNSNPCLELSCPLLATIIPNLIENVLELTMDARFPPAVRYSAKIPRYLGRTQDLNKFELVFDERAEQILAFEDNMLDSNLLQEKQDEFQDNDQQWQDNA